MKKLLLIHPPHYNSIDDRLDAPLGLLLLASAVRDKCTDWFVQVLDLSGMTEFEIPYADVYGITAYVSSLDFVKYLVQECRKINDSAKIVVGGAHASACPEDFDFVDYVVRGYGEKALIDILKGEVNDKVIIGNGNYVELSLPSYDLVSLRTYHRRINNELSVPFITSRGCPYRCVFCGMNVMHELNSQVYFLWPELVYEQLKYLKKEYGIKAINFQDDIFTLNKSRFIEMMQLISKLDIKFRCMGRAGYDDEDTYRILAEAGCVQVCWGIESGSQHILDMMRKDVTVDDNYNVIQWARKYGISSRAFFILGFPGEHYETIQQTKYFIQHADPDQVFVSNFIPYPGTDVWRNYEDYGITYIDKDYSNYYQVSKDGTGGLTIDTLWLTREEFRKLELEFREWLRNRGIRGEIQAYEQELYKR